ncbi:MAG: hypothetical protein R2849_18750 [Thermomicrobiales bacterium]
MTGPIGDIIGEGQGLEIGVDRHEAAVEFLRDLPEIQEARIDDGRIVVVTDPEAAARINRALVEAGFAVHLIRPHEDMLEARFLALTSATEAEDANGTA